MLVVIYAKILHHSFTPTIYENFKSVLISFNFKSDLFRANENLEICMPVWIVQLNESKQSWYNFTGCFKKWTLSQKYKIAFSLKTAVF